MNRLLFQQELSNREQRQYPSHVVSVLQPQEQSEQVFSYLQQQLSPDPWGEVLVSASGYALPYVNKTLPLPSQNDATQHPILGNVLVHEYGLTQSRQFAELRFQQQNLAAQQNLLSNLAHSNSYEVALHEQGTEALFALSKTDSLFGTKSSPSRKGKTEKHEKNHAQKEVHVVKNTEGTKAKQKPEKEKPRKNDSKWLSTLEELKEYKNQHGDCIVKRGYMPNPHLAHWVAGQRKQYKLLKKGKRSSMTRERVALLEELGFSWNAQEAAWERQFRDLKTFSYRNGNCQVPLYHQDYPKLGLWVKEQRRHYTLLKQGKPSHMTPERAAKLDKIGFCWDTQEASWLEHLSELKVFKEKYGSCIVPKNFTGSPTLRTWVHHQRRQYKSFKEGKPCHITEERIKALDTLGFIWHRKENSLSDQDESCESGTHLSSLDFRPHKRKRSTSR